MPSAFLLRRILSVAVIGLSLVAAPVRAETLARSDNPINDYQIIGPFTHDNLSIYLIGDGTDGQEMPLTLQSALEQKLVTVFETNDVNELAVQNNSNTEIFLQAGDIVKGGQQDRVLSVDVILPANSKRIPIAAFCVEQGRWSARGNENVANFESTDKTVASSDIKRELKKAANKGALSSRDDAEAAEPRVSVGGEEQSKVWGGVAEHQRKLSEKLKVDTKSAASPSSLQLTLENEEVIKSVAAYQKALTNVPNEAPYAKGYIAFVNGAFHGADVYGSTKLFRGMWPKLLEASATEAIAELSDKPAVVPSENFVAEILANAEQGRSGWSKSSSITLIETRESAQFIYTQTERLKRGWVHRSYVPELAVNNAQ